MSMKYLQLVGNDSEYTNNVLSETPGGSGCYQWIKVFDGNYGKYEDIKENLEDFDVVHINMVPASFGNIVDAHTKLKNSSTKLVLNNDYVPEMWKEWKTDPLLYHNLQKLGDCVFGTEPIQTSQMIEGAHCIPHPTDTKGMKLFKGKLEGNTLGCFYNPYDKDLYHISLMANRLKDDFGFRTKLLNYGVQNELHGYCKKYYDRIVGIKPFFDWMMELASMKSGFMPFLYSGYNRAAVETACLGVPVVGSNRSYSINQCYPDLAVDPLDYKAIKEKFTKLKNDSFRDRIVSDARDKSEFFGFSESKKRYIKMLEECDKK